MSLTLRAGSRKPRQGRKIIAHGVSRGIGAANQSSPDRGERTHWYDTPSSYAPCGAGPLARCLPTAGAVGFNLSPATRANDGRQSEWHWAGRRRYDSFPQKRGEQEAQNGAGGLAARSRHRQPVDGFNDKIDHPRVYRAEAPQERE